MYQSILYYFFNGWITHCMNIPHFVCLLVDGHLDCFYFFVRKKDVAVKIHVQGFVWTYVFICFENTLRNRVYSFFFLSRPLLYESISVSFMILSILCFIPSILSYTFFTSPAHSPLENILHMPIASAIIDAY